MEFFSNSKPELIGPKIKNTVFNIMKKKTVGGATISDKLSNNLSIFYQSYIEPNRTLFFVVILFALFLFYRYSNRKNNVLASNKKNKEQFSDEDSAIIDEIINQQTSHLKYDTQPSFNPIEPVYKQEVPINYPPDPLPVNIPDQEGIVYTKDLYDYPKSFTPLNTLDYDYDNVYKNPKLAYYTGTYNTYKDARDTNIPNPLGFNTNFNTSTGDFVKNMTDANNNNILDYQTVVDNLNGNLINSLKLGPKYLNTSEPDLEMEPPYADDL